MVVGAASGGEFPCPSRAAANIMNGMQQVNSEEMRQNFAVYLQRVRDGETLIVSEDGKPIAEIKPVRASEAAVRPYGLCREEFRVTNDFDAPLPAEIIDAFEGE